MQFSVSERLVDIAVDGWALTLLSKPNLSYASTAQTAGLNTGYFLSFTVFLAFNSLEFSNKYFRPSAAPLDYPLVTLPGYLRFAAVAYLAVTAYLVFLQKEVRDKGFKVELPLMPSPSNEQDAPEHNESEMGIRKVYSIMYSICKLKRKSVHKGMNAR